MLRYGCARRGTGYGRRDAYLDTGRGIFADCNEGSEPGIPDGLKVDSLGRVYCTAPGGIWVHGPSGKPICRIKTPGHHPTNIAFGDDDWKTMYVTNIGSVTRFRLNIAGVPSR